MTEIRERQSGFTLLEILIALGVLAVGITAVLGLLAAAISSGKRAQDQLNSALLAESIIADVEHDLDLSFDHSELDSLDSGDSDPFRTRVLVAEQESSTYPGYRFRALITPLSGPQDMPDEFLLEVRVGWSERGQWREITYPAVVLRHESSRDRPAPPQQAVGSG